MIKGSHHTKEAKEKIREANKDNTNRLGKYHSKETKRKMSEARSREKCYKWKGGIKHDSEGYLHFKAPKKCKFSSMKNKDGYILIHRLVMAECLQRPLRPEEVVHHINGNITDNGRENLMLLKNKGEHNSLHKTKGGEK